MEILSKKEISDLDIYIEQLKLCLPLEECQIKNLCEKVIFLNLFYIHYLYLYYRPEKY